MSKGNLLKKAKLDASRMILKGGFSVDIELTTPDKLTSYETSGLATKHHISINSEGLPINSKNAHVLLDEKELTELGIQVRDLNGEVKLINYFVKVKDSSDVLREYVISENLPNETIGMIVCILSDVDDNNNQNHY